MEVRSAATLVEARAAKVRDVVPVPAEGRNSKGQRSFRHAPLRRRYYELSTPLASARRAVIDCRKLRLSPLRDGCYSDAAGALERCSSCAPSRPSLFPFRAV